MSEQPSMTEHPVDEDWDEDGRARISGDVSLGEPTSCESCGTNYDRLSWYYDAGAVHITTSLGCYGGEQVSIADLDEAVAYFTDLAARVPEARRALAREAATMREQVAAHRR